MAFWKAAFASFKLPMTLVSEPQVVVSHRQFWLKLQSLLKLNDGFAKPLLLRKYHALAKISACEL